MNKLRAALSFFALTALFFGSCGYAAEGGSSEYPALIRPGVYAGSGRTLSYADYFLPFQSHRNDVVFMDLKTVFGNHGDSEQNAGVGYRHLNADETGIWGVNGFYDTRYSVNNNYIHQFGFGFEYLTPSVDFRANVYLPTTDMQLISQSDSYSFGSTNVVRTTHQTFEEPLDGLDGEIGVLIPGISEVVETRVFAGAYYYASDLSKDIPGWRARVEASPSPFLTLEFSVKDDRTIDTEYYGGGYVTLPFDIGNLFQGKNPFQGAGDYLKWGRGTRPMKARMTDRIVRDIDITAKNTNRATAVNAVERLIYVDNTNTSGIENGSKERPFNTLSEGIAAATAGVGDWVYVRAGDGTATGYTGNYTLKNAMTLWGEGYQAFPGLGGGQEPVLQGTGNTGTILSVVANNTIQGLKLQNAIQGIGGGAIDTLLVRHNTFTTFTGNGDDGNAIAVFSNSLGGLTARIENNVISNVAKSGGGDDGYGIIVAPILANSSITAFINNNTIVNTESYGLSLVTVGANTFLDVSASGNTIRNQATGVLVTDLGGTGTFNIDLGGGTLGSTGRNSISNHSPDNVINNVGALTVKAENNYWGGGAGTFSGTVDGAPFLTTDPNA